MDRTEHKLRLIHSLGELLPMHNYTTEVASRAAPPPHRSVRSAHRLGAARPSAAPAPALAAKAHRHALSVSRPHRSQYGNSLTRPSKHKALLAGAIEIRVSKDEVAQPLPAAPTPREHRTLPTPRRARRLISTRHSGSSHLVAEAPVPSTCAPPPSLPSAPHPPRAESSPPCAADAA